MTVDEEAAAMLPQVDGYDGAAQPPARSRVRALTPAAAP